MKLLFTALVIVCAYLMTVNRRNANKIRNLKNQVFELDQLVNILLLRYGKKEKKER